MLLLVKRKIGCLYFQVNIAIRFDVGCSDMFDHAVQFSISMAIIVDVTNGLSLAVCRKKIICCLLWIRWQQVTLLREMIAVDPFNDL